MVHPTPRTSFQRIARLASFSASATCSRPEKTEEQEKLSVQVVKACIRADDLSISA